MSSFPRRMQRSLIREEKGCRAPFYRGRGAKLGVTNPPRKRKPKAKKTAPTAAQLRARVVHTYRAPTRAERADAHRVKMAQKAARRG